MKWEYLVGDVREVLGNLPEGSVHTIVTSPPYWGLRDYGIPPSIWGGEPECEHEWGEEPGTRNIGRDDIFWGGVVGAKELSGQKQKHPISSETCRICGAWRGCLGLEPTPEMYVEHMLEVCRCLWRVLRDDGTFFLNLGDSYVSTPAGTRGAHARGEVGDGVYKRRWDRDTVDDCDIDVHYKGARVAGLKPKDLVMMPARVALALQADGWTVRSKVIWFKPNPMPESCTDRPTSSYEEIFELTKKARYFYDADAVREPHTPTTWSQQGAIGGRVQATTNPIERSGDTEKGRALTPGERFYNPSGRNLRNVWQIATQPYKNCHFATFPEKIPETCIKAGTSERGCCPQCGAPWERVVEVEHIKTQNKHDGRHCATPDGQNWAGMVPANKSVTTKGFQPTCECVEDWKRRCGADSKGEYHGKAIKDYKGTGAENPSEVKARILAGMVPKITTGFQPTCDCPPELEPVPCVVLDPFAGSGTTLKVARDLGRSAIGIDISDEYRELATERAMLNVPDIESFA